MNFCPKEHDEQKAVMAWSRAMDSRFPELAMLHATPNGGHRHPATAARLKAEGVKPGVPDLHLPVGKGNYHGLWIELKRRKGGRLSPDQKWWVEQLERYDNRVVVCRGYDEAVAAILGYLNLPGN